MTKERETLRKKADYNKYVFNRVYECKGMPYQIDWPIVFFCFENDISRDNAVLHILEAQQAADIIKTFKDPFK